jgi:group I intron endonuclease
MGHIYVIKNKVNGKIYIGQTMRPIRKRLEEHETGKIGCRAIYNAIQKYGWDNFEKDYYECSDEDLNKHEKWMVKLMGTLSPDGYNLKEGGAGGKLSEETKQRVGDGNRGKFVSEETKQKNREASLGEKNPMYGKTGEKSPNYGRPHTKESIQKMVEATLGENNHASKRVYQYDVDGTFINSFGSSEEAARYLKGEGAYGSSIRACARGRRNYNTAHGFKWSYELDVFM